MLQGRRSPLQSLSTDSHEQCAADFPNDELTIRDPVSEPRHSLRQLSRILEVRSWCSLPYVSQVELNSFPYGRSLTSRSVGEEHRVPLHRHLDSFRVAAYM